MGIYRDTLVDCVKHWLRFLIAAVLLIIPGVNLLVFGYVLEVMKRARSGNGKGLPPWQGLGSLFIRGLQLLLTCAVWIAPLFLLVFVGFWLMPSAILVISGFSLVMGIAILYLLPSIFVKESKGWGKSFSLSTVTATFDVYYLFHWLIFILFSFVFAMITKPAPVFNTIPSMFLLLAMGRVFTSLEAKK